ncbi:hypothetical protein [Alienimonas californiensis]|uniref:hypothetical protein n=1 Tax=Alienimonas californiensis TaxID=2527989 RepID=UPI0011A6A8A7|nr:hypothetical protein [Alienimonas californiensis]
MPPRPLTDREATLVRWLLTCGGPIGARFLPEVDDLRVVGLCGCGCASVDFVRGGDGGMRPFARHQWDGPDGEPCGVFLYTIEDRLAGLEVHSCDGPAGLPNPSKLRPGPTLDG